MANDYTMRNLAEEVLQQAENPLSSREIWQAGVSTGLADKVGSQSKTPWKSIDSILYVDTKPENEKISQFLRVSDEMGGTKFWLRSRGEFKGLAPVEPLEKISSKRPREHQHERDLHVLLSTFVYGDKHFHCSTMTIKESESKRGKQHANEWTHPDMVGVRFPFDEYGESTLKLIQALNENPYELFSFELKWKVDRETMRQSYFQAVSNSSWANEGYLVTQSLSEDVDFRDDLQRLVDSFGIGVILLNARHIEESEIIYPARHRTTLDWPQVDHVAAINPGFRRFIDHVVYDNKKTTARSNFETVLKPEEYEDYLEKHGFLNQ